ILWKPIVPYVPMWFKKNQPSLYICDYCLNALIWRKFIVWVFIPDLKTSHQSRSKQINFMNNRRLFLKQLGVGALGLTALPAFAEASLFEAKKKMFFDISLAQWSLHKTLFAGKLDNLDFPEVAAKTYGIHAVEYVNQFFKDKAKDTTYLKELKKRAKDNKVKNVLIMIDG